MTDLDLETQLTGAIRWRAEREPVTVPQPGAVMDRTPSPSPGRRPAHRLGVLAAAAVIMVVAGVALVRPEVGRVDTATTTPDGATSAPSLPSATSDPTSTATSAHGGTGADGGREPAVLPRFEPAADELTPDALEAGEPLQWTEVAAPTSDFHVLGLHQIMGALGDDAVVLDDNGNGWLWSPTASWRRLATPPDHVLLQVVSGPTTDRLIVTVGMSPATAGTWLWSVDGDGTFSDPQRIRVPDLPDPLGDHLVASAINQPSIAGSRDHLVVVRSYGPRLDIERLLVDRGFMAEGDQLCDLSGDAEVLAVTVSPSAPSDGRCATAPDRRSFEVTAEDLDVPPADFALEYGPAGADDRYRTAIYEGPAGAEPSASHDVPGVVSQVVDGPLGVVVTTADSSGHWHLTQRVDGAGWTDQAVNGAVVLSTDPRVGAVVVTSGGAAYQLSPDQGQILRGALPSGWTRVPDLILPAPAPAVIVADTDPALMVDAWAVGVSTTGERWSWVDLRNDLGYDIGSVTATSTHLFLHALPLRGPGGSFYTAPLPPP